MSRPPKPVIVVKRPIGVPECTPRPPSPLAKRRRTGSKNLTKSLPNLVPALARVRVDMEA
jgi:hypothetical protein